jgi:Protein of unknown function (DUF2934)
MHQANSPAKLKDEEIANRAYELWLLRGRPRGYDSEIWRDAEYQLQHRLPARLASATPGRSQPFCGAPTFAV